MKKNNLIIFIVAGLWLAGCNMHDGQGWEHTGDGKNDSPSSPYVLEHKH